MSIIILELNTSRAKFEDIVESFIIAKGLQFSIVDTNKIDLAYNEIVQNLVNNVMESIKNKKLSASVIDSIDTDYMPIVDKFAYFLFSEYGVDIDFEVLQQMVSSIEISIINDIVSFLPNVDDRSLELIGHYFKPINSLVIEYKDAAIV